MPTTVPTSHKGIRPVVPVLDINKKKISLYFYKNVKHRLEVYTINNEAYCLNIINHAAKNNEAYILWIHFLFCLYFYFYNLYKNKNISKIKNGLFVKRRRKVTSKKYNYSYKTILKENGRQ